MRAAMVLAAGRGTRLAPLTAHRAKPLVPVGDRPVLAHVLGRLRAAGVERVVVNAHHRAEDVRAFASAEIGVVVSDEPELLGTAGGLAHAHDRLGEGDVLVWNGDILARPNLGALFAAHAAFGAQATLAITPRACGQGSVGTDAAGRIVRLRRESVGGEVQGGEFIGIHVVGARLRAALPAQGCLVGDAYIPALQRGATLRAFACDTPVFDIGTLPRYMDANLDWLVENQSSRFVGSGVILAPGVTLDRTIIGAGARIGGAGVLTRCVVWPGARALAPISDAVVVGELVVGIRDGP